MGREESRATRRPAVAFGRRLVALVTTVAVVATLVAAVDAHHPRPAAAEGLPGGNVDCGFGLFCGPVDLGVPPPTTGGQFLYRVVQPNTPEETAAGEVDSAQAWAALETDAKAAVSALYGVPNDGRIVAWARDDVVSYMFNRLLWLLIQKDDGVAIEPYEQAWLDHFADELQRKRIKDAQSALSEYDRWEADPCHFQPPAGYGFDPYSPLCAGIGGQFQPPPPSADQFTQYGAALVNSEVFASADVTARWNKVAELASLAGSIAAGTLVAALVGNVVGLTATTTGLLAKLFPYAARAGVQVIQEVGSLASTGVGIVIAIAAAVTAAGTWREIETAATLPKLQTRLATEQSTTPDLTGILTDEDQMKEAFGVLLAETLPDHTPEERAANPPRPWSADTDPLLRHTDGSTTSTVTTTDWDGRPQVTYLVDGWFVTSDAGGAYEYSPTLEYLMADGRKAKATLNNGHFLIDILPANDSQIRITSVQSGFADVVAVAGNHRPAVHVLVTDNLHQGAELTFDAGATDPDGDDVSVKWYLQPDGSFPVACINVNTAETDIWQCPWALTEGSTITKRYTSTGDYYGRVVVTDAQGATTEQRFGFRVLNVAPEVTVDPPVAVTEGSAATISGTFSDIGGDAERVTIDWGDGTTSTQWYPCAGEVAADGSCATLVLGKTAQPTAWFRTHVYDDPPPLGQSAYTVTVRVSDGAEVVRTVQQPVNPMPLTIPELTAADTTEGGTMAVTGRIDNPSFDPFVLTLDVGDGLGPVDLAYPCAAGSVCPFSTTPPPGGFFICQEPCRYVWFTDNVPVGDDPAGPVDTRTVSAAVRKTMTGTLDTRTDSATIANVAPALSVDPVASVVAGAETIVTGSVTDPGPDTGTLDVDWGDGTTSSVDSLLDGPFQLHHTYASPGQRPVALQATDDDGGASLTLSRSASVTPVANQAPVLAPPAQPLALSEDGSLLIDLGHFIQSDDLTAAASLGVAVTHPAHGSLSGTGLQRTYTPDADYHGPDSFDLSVTDGGSPTGCSPTGTYCLAPASSTITIPLAIASVNDVPVVHLSGAASANEGSTITFTYAVSDRDGLAGGVPTVGCGTTGVLTWSVGATFACTFPDGPAASTVSATFTDVEGAAGSDSIAVSVSNVAPSLQTSVSPASLLVLPGETVTVSGSFTDPGDDQGTVTVVWGDGSTSTLPAQGPGAFQATHAYVVASTFTIIVTVADGNDSRAATYHVVVAAGAAAVEAIAGRLAGADTRGLTKKQDKALERAIDLLAGKHGGAAALFATDPVAALDEIESAVEQLAAVPLGIASTSSRALAALSRKVAVDAIAAAKTRTGCTSYALPTCSKNEAKALHGADAGLASGDTALADGDLVRAVGWYRDATNEAIRA